MMGGSEDVGWKKKIMSEQVRIRRARVDEARLLTELTTRSKAYWGYEASFLAKVRSELEFQPGRFFPEFHVYVLETPAELLGYCSLIPQKDGQIELHDLFIEPRHIGKGYGKQLWDYAVNLARELGFRTLVLTADPHAAPFYERQDAIRTGEKTSSTNPARKLPTMAYRLRE